MKAILGALIFVLGAQSIRFLFGSITWYLRDTVGIGTLDLIPIALAPFLAGLLLPVVSRWMSVNRALWAGLWILVAARTLNQVSPDPQLDFWMASVGTAAFVGLLPLLASMGRSALVGGLLLGLAVDSAIRGMGLSLDLAFQSGVAPLVGVLGLSAAAMFALWAAPGVERQGVAWGAGARLVGIAPFLFFELLILQNQGWMSEVAGMTGAQAQLRIALLNVLTLVVVSRFENNRMAVLGALAAFLAAVGIAEGGRLAFNLVTLAAVPAAGLTWSSMVPDPERRGVAASATWLVAGMTLFVILGLAYYVPMDIDLGFDQQQARLAVAGLLLLFGLAGLLSQRTTRPGATGQLWAFAALASLLPFLGLLTSSTVRSEVGDELPLRVMSFNIHSSYGTDGTFDIEAIAQLIEDSGATIVGLQEVPRGRLLSGLTDQVTLLQQRLGFEYSAFFGTTDPTWGNAILSKYPITATNTSYLPLAGTLLQRGYLGATLDTPAGSLLFITTHLQHVNDPDVHDDDPEADLYPVHHEQLATVLAEWGGVQPAVATGDFNARPGWGQIEEFEAAGWVDSWDEAGVGDGFTANAADPKHRIDYVFHTPDLVATDAGVILSQASDHFAVVVDITLS